MVRPGMGPTATAPGADAGYHTGVGASRRSGMGQWHPTILFLLGLVIAEIVIFNSMRHMTKHGG